MVQQSRRFCFTTNNFRPDDCLIPTNDNISYYIYQLEVGESGTPHLQGYVEIKKKKTIAGVKKIPFFKRSRIAIALGTREESVEYCTKLSDRIPGTIVHEWGIPIANGVSTNYSGFVKAITNGASIQDLIDNHAEEYIRHKRGADELVRELKKMKKQNWSISPIVYYKWQVKILDLIKGNPDPRLVHWFTDRLGGLGKSTFAKILIKSYDAILIDTTKKERVIRAYNGEPIVIFDITRQEGQEQSINYAIMETLKNGYGFNTMYEPGLKLWDTPFVLVFSNCAPDESKLSADRWDITDLDREDCF